MILASKWVDNEGGDLVHEPDKKIGIVFMHMRLSLVLYHYVLPVPIGLSSWIAVIPHKLIELFFSKQPNVYLFYITIAYSIDWKSKSIFYKIYFGCTNILLIA